MPHAQARRHFLHDRSELIRNSALKFAKPAPQAPALLFSWRFQAKHALGL